METTAFADLSGTFSPIITRDGHLDEYQLTEAIAEQQLRKTYWRVTFRRVQYGTYQGSPACLIVVDGKFAPEDRRRHRFTWARIKVQLLSDGGGNSSVQVLKLAPERAYGVTIPEVHTSNWALRSRASIAMPGIPITIDLLEGERGHKRTYVVDRIASMQGSERGFPYAKEAVWTLEEANQEGIPWRIPSLVVLVKYTAGSHFKAKFTIDAKIGWSINPMRWPIFAEASKPVTFDGKTELAPEGDGEFDNDFTFLDLSKLTRLDFTDDR